jgi:UDP-N-acetylmuramate dehydrogenase
MLQRHVSLKPFNTFGMQATAEWFAPFRSLDQLHQLVDDAHSITAEPPLILGGGSNILFTGNVDGVLLKNEMIGIDKTGDDEAHIYIKVGGGENWHRFVLHCLEHGYAGVENLALIPGSVGASPMQNIGAYGVEIKDVFHSLEAFHLRNKTMHAFSKEDCRFGYRESVFKHHLKGQFVITSVTFKLFKNPVFHTSYGAIQQELEAMGATELTIRNIAQAVINIRSSKLPDWNVIGNAGSFFKNPEIENQQYEDLKKLHPNLVAFPVANGRTKLAAGWLIEQCGWKGYRNGDAGCYPKQALVLVNYGNATGAEIYDLSEKILRSVKLKFAITLEREVNVI